MHAYEVRPRKDHRGVDLISDALPFGRLCYAQVSHTIGYAEFYSRSRDAVIRVYDDSGNLIETHEQAGEFKGPALLPTNASPGPMLTGIALARRLGDHLTSPKL